MKDKLVFTYTLTGLHFRKSCTIYVTGIKTTTLLDFHDWSLHL